MSNYAIYEEYLSKKLTAMIVIAAVVFAIWLIAVFVGVYIKAEKVYFIVLICLFLLLAAVLIWGFTPYILDISQNSYVEYSGEVVVEDVYSRGSVYRAIINIYDAENMQFDIACKYRIPEGKYNAEFVYSKHSRVIFEWKVTE